MRKYNYEFHGTAARGQTWQTSGQINDPTNDLNRVFDSAMRETFTALTGGRAVYGKPGVGCAGPYGVARIVITLEPTEST